ncbi:RNA polymerase sigma-70 factor [Parabacteroides sp. APC149_11_2_Y6]
MEFNVKDLKIGDERVLRRLILAYKSRLFKFSMIYVLRAEIAEEIVQDVFLTLWEKRAELSDSTCLIQYLMVVTRNRCLNYIRNEKLETIPIDVLTEEQIYLRSNAYVLDDGTLCTLFSKDLEKMIEASLQKLSPKTREIFRMSRKEGMKNKEIAEKLEVIEKTVEYHLMKAIKQIKSDLPDDYKLLLALFYGLY